MPFDFSLHSSNAMIYALNFSKYYEFDIEVFHAVELPVIAAESSFINYPLKEIIEENKIALENEINRLKKISKTEAVSYTIHVETGMNTSRLIEEAEEKFTDLIIMSVSSRNKFGELFIGSNSIITARNSTIPVLLIPDKKTFNAINNIMLALDASEEVGEHFYTELKFWTDLFNAELRIVIVQEESKAGSITNTIGELDAENKLSHLQHKTFYLTGDPKTEIERMIKNQNPDLLISAPRKHNFFEDILNKSLTKHLAYHSEIPLMTIINQ